MTATTAAAAPVAALPQRCRPCENAETMTSSYTTAKMMNRGGVAAGRDGNDRVQRPPAPVTAAATSRGSAAAAAGTRRR